MISQRYKHWRRRRPAAARLQARLISALAKKGAASGALVGLWVAGAGLLIWRFADTPASSTGSEWFAVTVIPVFAFAVTGALLALRRLPSRESCSAALDAHNRAGGLLMCRDYAGAEEWEARGESQPGIEWGAGRLARAGALALVFVLAVAMLPEGLFIAPESYTPATGAIVERVADKLSLLEEEELLEGWGIEELANDLAEVTERGAADDPARTLEALDHIEEELARRARAGAEAIAESRLAELATLALMEQLSEFLETGAAGPATADSAARLLTEFLEGSLPDELAGELLSRSADLSTLNPETLARMAELLREASAITEDQLRRLAELGLIDLAELRPGSCDNAADCADALTLLLADGGDGAGAAAELLALCEMGGSGAPTRGPVAAPMIFGESTEMVELAMREKLDAATLFAGETRLTGLSAAAPEVPEKAVAARGGFLDRDGASGAAGSHEVILPRHRAAVRRYFSTTSD